MSDYEQDFYAWTQEQAAALRDRKWDTLDLANLAEEIESLGRSHRTAAWLANHDPQRSPRHR